MTAQLVIPCCFFFFFLNTSLLYIHFHCHEIPLKHSIYCSTIYFLIAIVLRFLDRQIYLIIHTYKRSSSTLFNRHSCLIIFLSFRKFHSKIRGCMPQIHYCLQSFTHPHLVPILP